MGNQNEYSTNKILPPIPEHRNDFGLHFKTMLEEIFKAIETVETHMPKQDNPIKKFFNRPPKGWNTQVLLTFHMISKNLEIAQNSLDGLKEIWPQGWMATDYFQNLVDHFNEWMDINSEIANLDWSYLDRSDRKTFEALSTKNKTASAILDNEISMISTIYQKIVNDLEPYGLREWAK